MGNFYLQVCVYKTRALNVFFPTKTPGLSVLKTTFEPAPPSAKYQRFFFAGIRIYLSEQNFNRCCPHLTVLLICFDFVNTGKHSLW